MLINYIYTVHLERTLIVGNIYLSIFFLFLTKICRPNEAEIQIIYQILLKDQSSGLKKGELQI
jgi:hypothetical protein